MCSTQLLFLHGSRNNPTSTLIHSALQIAMFSNGLFFHTISCLLVTHTREPGKGCGIVETVYRDGLETGFRVDLGAQNLS